MDCLSENHSVPRRSVGSRAGRRRLSAGRVVDLGERPERVGVEQEVSAFLRPLLLGCRDQNPLVIDEARGGADEHPLPGENLAGLDDDVVGTLLRTAETASADVLADQHPARAQTDVGFLGGARCPDVEPVGRAGDQEAVRTVLAHGRGEQNLGACVRELLEGVRRREGRQDVLGEYLAGVQVESAADVARGKPVRPEGSGHGRQKDTPGRVGRAAAGGLGRMLPVPVAVFPADRSVGFLGLPARLLAREPLPGVTEALGEQGGSCALPSPCPRCGGWASRAAAGGWVRHHTSGRSVGGQPSPVP